MLKAIVAEMRIKQWTKNLLVFAALLFSGSVFQIEKFWLAMQMFIAFCLVSSAVYFFNDICDVDKDRKNPQKCRRPIAAGKITVKAAYVCASLLALSGILITVKIGKLSTYIVISYLLINILYTVKLKHMVILDVMVIAYGFVARALAGALLLGKPITMWFILCILFLSLFLALGKRRHELWSLRQKHLQEGRHVLQYYSLELIDQLMTIVTAAVLLCYALFAMEAFKKEQYMMLMTIPIVIYGIFYYLYVVRVKHSGGAPDELLYKERPICVSVVFYVMCIIFARNF